MTQNSSQDSTREPTHSLPGDHALVRCTVLTGSARSSSAPRRLAAGDLLASRRNRSLNRHALFCIGPAHAAGTVKFDGSIGAANFS